MVAVWNRVLPLGEIRLLYRKPLAPFMLPEEVAVRATFLDAPTCWGHDTGVTETNVENFTAIINPGESAILAVSSTIRKPVVRKGRITARDIMKMTLSADHRIVDGALGGAFLKRLGDYIESFDPESGNFQN
jgi:hypothetical protein